jgi:hypothetical protein
VLSIVQVVRSDGHAYDADPALSDGILASSFAQSPDSASWRRFSTFRVLPGAI